MDVNRDRVRIRLLVNAIQLLLQHGFGDDTPEAPHHLLEDRQLSAGQADRVPSDRQLPPNRIETKIAGLERHSQHTTWTAQKRFDPPPKLSHRERFGQIIVGPSPESPNPVLDPDPP